MKAGFLVKQFDRAALALVAARRRRRRAAELADLRAIDTEDAGASGPRRVPSTTSGITRAVVRRRATLIAGGAIAVVPAVMLYSELTGPKSMTITAEPLDAYDRNVPGVVKDDPGAEQRREALAAVALLEVEYPERSRELRRTVMLCEDAQGGGVGNPACDDARERAIDAGRNLLGGNGGEPLR